MTQVCAQCGTPVKEGHRFCSNCGASVGAAVHAPAPPPPEPVEAPVNAAFDERVVAPPTLYGPQTPPPPPPARNAGPSRAATMRPDSKEGGMYVPYGVDSAAHLEGEKDSTSRVKPVI